MKDLDKRIKKNKILLKAIVLSMLFLILALGFTLTRAYAFDVGDENLPINLIINPSQERTIHDTSYDDYTRFISNYMGISNNEMYVYFPKNNEYSDLVYSAINDSNITYSRIELYDNEYNLAYVYNFDLHDDYIGVNGFWYNIDFSSYPNATYFRTNIIGMGIDQASTLNNEDALRDGLYVTSSYGMYFYLATQYNDNLTQSYDKGLYDGKQEATYDIYENGIDGLYDLDGDTSYDYGRGVTSGQNLDLSTIPKAMEGGLNSILSLDFGGISLGALLLIPISIGLFAWFIRLTRRS